MIKMRKYLAFALVVGLILSSMTVLAYDGTVNEKNENQAYNQFEGDKAPTASDGLEKGDYWYNTATDAMKQWNGTSWVATGCDEESSDSGSSDKSDSKSAAEKEAERLAEEKAAAERAAQAQASAESVRLEAEAADEGFVNGAQLQLAKAANKSAGEYNNNAVVKTPGIDNAVAVAQGGNLVVDGRTTGATAAISKVSVAFVDSVRAAQEGTVLNVVDVQLPAVAASVNFYMPGVSDSANIAAVQYLSGRWVDVEVTEVRADHVVLNLKSSGVVAFLEK